MKIKVTHVDIVPAIMTKDDPQWRFASRASPETKGFIVKVAADNGLTGLGYTNETAATGTGWGGIHAALELYSGLLVGLDPFDTEKAAAVLDGALSGNNEARIAIDIALHDLQARAVGLPLYALLGGLVREEVPVNRIVGLKEPAKMAANADRLVEQGYTYIKIKLEGQPQKDLERVKEIRKAVGDGIHLTVDANQSYTPKVAIDTLRRMCQLGIELAEQPVRADDWEGLAAVTRAVECPVEAHESVQNIQDVFRLVKDRVADSINLMLMRLGSLRNAQAAAAICKAGNVSCRVAASGSRVLSAASLHFVASTPNVTYACDLGEFSRFVNDPAGGLEIVDGKLKVPNLPGIGVSLRDAG